MSARLMVQLLEEEGLSPAMAHRLMSQIRKGAPLHKEWKEAFALGKFHFTSKVKDGSETSNDEYRSSFSPQKLVVSLRTIQEISSLTSERFNPLIQSIRPLFTRWNKTLVMWELHGVQRW